MSNDITAAMWRLGNQSIKLQPLPFGFLGAKESKLGEEGLKRFKKEVDLFRFVKQHMVAFALIR